MSAVLRGKLARADRDSHPVRKKIRGFRPLICFRENKKRLANGVVVVSLFLFRVKEIFCVLIVPKRTN